MYFLYFPFKLSGAGGHKGSNIVKIIYLLQGGQAAGFRLA
jgi:hypothetical protein